MAVLMCENVRMVWIFFIKTESFSRLLVTVLSLYYEYNENVIIVSVWRCDGKYFTIFLLYS